MRGGCGDLVVQVRAAKLLRQTLLQLDLPSGHFVILPADPSDVFIHHPYLFRVLRVAERMLAGERESLLGVFAVLGNVVEKFPDGETPPPTPRFANKSLLLPQPRKLVIQMRRVHGV